MLKAINGKIFVEKVQKKKDLGESGQSFTGFSSLLKTNDNLGKVILIDGDQTSEFLKEGSLVYHGNKFESISLEGREVMVMDASNVLAIQLSNE